MAIIKKPEQQSNLKKNEQEEPIFVPDINLYHQWLNTPSSKEIATIATALYLRLKKRNNKASNWLIKGIYEGINREI